MTARHTTTGNAKPWVVATSYKHESPQYARFERPVGEPSLLVGTAVFLGGLAVIGILGVLM